jgi:S1-C subfamily serine protease/regulation of enolase protein 1 (concanavalin A-like superfamily)
MSMEFTCPYCLHTGRLPAGFAGGRVKCPSCRNATTVAPPEPPVLPLKPQESEPLPAPSPAAEPAPGESAEPEDAAYSLVPVPDPPTPERKPSAVPVEPKVVVEDPEDEPAEGGAARWWVVAAGAAGASFLALAVVGFVVVKVVSSSQPAPAVAAVNVSPGTAAPGTVPPPVGPPRAGTPPSMARSAAPGGVVVPGGLAAAPRPEVKVVGNPSASPSPSRPPAAKPPVNDPQPTTSEVVQRVKDATVYLKISAGSFEGSGTGFVVRVDGRAVYIATNDHVIRTSRNEEGDPEDPKIPSRITAVFRSGEPAGKEATLPARVVAFDREENRDLAVLRVDGMADPPVPIDLTRKAEPTETLPVLIHGFPFGDLNQMTDRTSHRNASITIARGSVSRLQRDDLGRLSYVQIDGSINPGNSGGPVVDEQGRLVGVAVMKITNSNIGFAVPAAELTRMLDGRVGRLRLGLTSESAGQIVLRASVGVIDPLERIRTVDLLVGPDTGPSPAPPEGNWPQIDSTDRVTLVRRGRVADGTIQTRLTRPGNRSLRVQACVRDSSGKIEFSKPESYVVPLRPSAPAIVGNDRKAPGSPRPDGVLGALVDPTKTCKMSRDGDAVVIDVPAGVHLLGPEFATRPAPMVLTDIEGDFAAQVQVTGALLPGTEPAKLKGHVLPNTFQGAGLVLFEDHKNYVRIERAGTAARGQPVVSSEVVVEVCDNGKIAGPFVQPVPEGPVYVRIERVSGGIRCMFGPNGMVWISLRQLATQFPKKIKVGLIASNASKAALSARFEGFSLSTP